MHSHDVSTGLSLVEVLVVGGARREAFHRPFWRGNVWREVTLVAAA